MTPAEILGWPTADIEKLSDADIERILAPMFPHTRPATPAPALTMLGDKIFGDMSPEMLAKIEALKPKPVKFGKKTT